MKFKLKPCAAWVAAIIAANLYGNVALAAANIRVVAAVPATDLGEVDPAAVMTVAVSLKLQDPGALAAFVASTVDKSSPNFHQFLTPRQFGARFGQTAASVASVKAYLESQGITVTKVYDNNLMLMAQGTNARLAQTFGTTIHRFSSGSITYQEPTTAPMLPAALQTLVSGVSGLSTRATLQSRLSTAPAHPATAPADMSVLKASGGTVLPSVSTSADVPTTGIVGQYSARDAASMYNATPLYNRGLTGAGTTLGILTFALYAKSDVRQYWEGIGLSGDTSRITNIRVNNGGTLQGDIETTLDVEQAGAIAPGANIRVYIAQNSDAGMLQLYSEAVNDNIADTLSISWGEPELETGMAASVEPIFMQAAAQGIPIIAAAGDAGAYDINTGFSYPAYSTITSVDYPSSSPYVLAAGGTTLPVRVVSKSGRSVSVLQERPWGWDYLRPMVVADFGQASYYANFFPVGGGGGVSVQFPMPTYQVGVTGAKKSAPGQSLFDMQNGQLIANIQPNFAGRNTPDVALNADPYSGYLIYSHGDWQTEEGGTSFVAPQLNGIFSLITEQNKQQHKGRVGWLQPRLYGFFKEKGYALGSPFKPVSYGSNLFYTSGPYYNPAAGLGTLDVDNLAKAFAE